MKFLFFVVLFWGFNSYGCDAASLPWKTADHVCNRDLCKVALGCEFIKRDVRFKTIRKGIGRSVFTGLPRFVFTSKKKREMLERVKRIAVLLLKSVLEDTVTFTPLELHQALRLFDQKIRDQVKEVLIGELERLFDDRARLNEDLTKKESETMNQVQVVLKRVQEFYIELLREHKKDPKGLDMLKAGSKLASAIVSVLDQMDVADREYVRTQTQKRCGTYCNTSYKCKWKEEQEIQREIDAINVNIQWAEREAKFWEENIKKIKSTHEQKSPGKELSRYKTLVVEERTGLMELFKEEVTRLQKKLDRLSRKKDNLVV